MTRMLEREQSVFVKFFRGMPLAKILDVLIEARPFDITKEDIIRQTGLSRNTVFKLWKDIIEKYNLVIVTRRIGKSNLYILNDENELVQELLRLEFILGKIAMEKALIQETKPLEA